MDSLYRDPEFLSLRKFHRRFHRLLQASWHHSQLCQDPSGPPRLQKGISRTLSRLSISISFQSLYGVFEDMEGPSKTGDGVRGLWEPKGSFTKILSKLDIRIHVKCLFNWELFFGSCYRTFFQTPWILQKFLYFPSLRWGTNKWILISAMRWVLVFFPILLSSLVYA